MNAINNLGSPPGETQAQIIYEHLPKMGAAVIAALLAALCLTLP